MLQAPPSVSPAPTPRDLTSPDIDRIQQDLADLDQSEIEQILTQEEKRFLLYVERGDVASVRHILKKAHKENKRKSKTFNINCVDPLGRSALAIAIENENTDMINLLLDSEIHPTDSLLYAINEEYVEGVEILLKHEETIHKSGTPYSWQTVTGVKATFTPDITPLIQAAIKDNYEILKLLLDRGASIPVPHDIRCACDECVTSNAEDSLRHSLSRINSYKALASPSLLCLSSKDPLMTAFALSNELKKLASIENEFKADYNKLRKCLQTFTSDLVDETRTSYELKVILNYDRKRGPHNPGDRNKLTRLKEAINSNQKQFVSHANVQQLLGSVWFDGMPGFRRLASVNQILEILKIGCMFPLYCFAFVLAPSSPMGVAIKKPFIKFIVHFFSYLFFLSLLVIVSLRVEVFFITLLGTDWMRARLKKQMDESRGAMPSVVELGIIVYIGGFLWSEIKHLWKSGLEEYFKDLWNLVDFMTNFCFLNWILMRGTAIFLVWREQRYGINPYTRRENWNDFDPMLFSEAMFCSANIFSFLKLVHLFSVNHHLGPLQISLGRMVFDILKFFFFYSLVLFAFACGINQLVGYYSKIDMEKCYSGPGGTINPKADLSCEIWRRFSNLFESAQTLFWASFGIVDLINFDLTGVKEFTRFWGMLMFGSYSVINVIVLLNLLIAMMSNSYAAIVERSDVEWKFARSKLWISYFEDHDILPPPFNLMGIFVPSTREEDEYKLGVQADKAEQRESQYQRVTRNLVRRYVTDRQRKIVEEAITEDDVNEVKQDIRAMKYEVLNILKINGWQTGTAHQCSGFGNPSKKQAARERRLMKGFNIGIVEGIEAANVAVKMGGSAMATLVFNLVKKTTQKDWNKLVNKNRKKDQIGSSSTSLRRQSLRNTQRQMTAWDKIQFYQKRGVFLGGEINEKTLEESSKKKIVITKKKQFKGWMKVKNLTDKGDLTSDNYERVVTPTPDKSPSNEDSSSSSSSDSSGSHTANPISYRPITNIPKTNK